MIERLLAAERVVARSDGSEHTLFPVGVNAAEGEALREWVKREGATRTVEIGLGYGIREEVSRSDDLHHWAVLRTARTPIERPFDHYVDF